MATESVGYVTGACGAGDWDREAACGGRGGGRVDMAKAGANDPAMFHAAITAAKAFAEQNLK